MHKRINYIFCFLVIASLSGCAYYNTFYNAKKFYREAVKERKKRTRTQIVELSPEEKQLMKKQGLSTESEADRPGATEMQNYQKAIEKASSLLEFYPKSRWVDDALILLGECFYYRREFSKAQRKFEEIIQLYPTSEFIPTARLLLAKNYIGLQEFNKAEALLREMVVNKELPKSIREEAEYELAGLYYEKETYDLAADAYRKSAKESDDKLISALSLYRLGECLVSLKQPEEAVTIFRRAAKESPNEDFKSQSTFKLGESQSMIGDYEAATRTFSTLLAKELEVKRIPLIKLQLANNLRLSGKLNEAIKWYDNIIKEHSRTDASAKSYFVLAEIQELKEGDYAKAKEYYDLVRGEFANSLVAPKAKERSDHIKTLLELTDSIHEMLGIKSAKDSLKAEGGKGEEKRNQRDDAPINLSGDGMWINYSGRDRPPPKTLVNLTEEDKLRAQAAPVTADSLSASGGTASAKNDSVSLAAAAERAVKDKARKLAEQQLALGELLMFHFDNPDSAMSLFVRVCELKVDSAMSARSFYSIAYILKFIKHDTATADSVFRSIIHLYPKSPHAEGARKQLGLPLLADRVDSAAVLFRQAEKAAWQDKDAKKALRLYEQLEQRYPASSLAEKALYARGWMYENMLYEYDQALTIYQSLTKEHPKSVFAQKVTTKLQAHERAVKELAEKAKADSTKAAAGDSSKAGTAADSLQVRAPLDSLKAASTTADSSARMADVAKAKNRPAATTHRPDSLIAPASASAQTPADSSTKRAQEVALEEAEQQALQRASRRPKTRTVADTARVKAPRGEL